MQGRVREVNFFEGVTVVDTDAFPENTLFTMPPYIFGDGLRLNAAGDLYYRDHTFVHEYGHFLQSQRWGWFYIPLIGIPSAQSVFIGDLDGGENHDLRWFETGASRYGADYFDHYYGAGAFGYTPASVDYFDRNSFVNDMTTSPYFNPRNGNQNDGGHPQRGQLQLSDPSLYLYLVLVLAFF